MKAQQQVKNRILFPYIFDYRSRSSFTLAGFSCADPSRQASMFAALLLKGMVEKNPDYFYSLQCSNNVMLLLKCLMVYSASETNFLNPRFLLCFFFKQEPNSYFKVKMCPPLSSFFFLKIKIGK